MELNGFTGMAHQFHQADCTQWLEEHRHRFDLIFLDPPTFSNSKAGRKSWIFSATMRN